MPLQTGPSGDKTACRERGALGPRLRSGALASEKARFATENSNQDTTARANP